LTAAEKVAFGDKIIFTPDGVHPYEESGHPLYFAAITRSIPLLKSAVLTQRSLPYPLDVQNWENARLIPLDAVETSGDWHRLASTHLAAKQGARMGGKFLVAGKPGSSLTFRFQGTGFGLYGIKGPDVGQFIVTVDGGSTPIIATLFDSFCTENRYRICPWIYPQALADAEHTVKIEIHPEPPDKEGILKRDNFDPIQFDGKNLYVSDVLILGRIQKRAPVLSL
jgi:hypothetical protein